MNEVAKQLEAQKLAAKMARETGQPVHDGYGSLWYSPGVDGIPIVGPSNAVRDGKGKVTAKE